MSWEDRRAISGVGTIARHAAHSDDAKHRPDDATHLRPRARWLVPVAIGVAVLLLGAGTVAVARSRSASSPAAGHGRSRAAGKHSSAAHPVTPLPHSAIATGTGKAIYYDTGIIGGPWAGTLTVDCTAAACTVSRFVSPTATQLFGFRMLHAKAMHLSAVGTDSYAGTAAANNGCDRPPDRSTLTLSGDQVRFTGYWHGPPNPIPRNYFGCMNDGPGRFEFIGRFGQAP